jgi:hypothetical protein
VKSSPSYKKVNFFAIEIKDKILGKGHVKPEEG